MTTPPSLSSATLFRPIRIGTLEIPNRIVMPGMGLNLAENGVPTAEIAQYYRRRVEGGAGLIMTEASFIDHPSSSNHPQLMRFNSEESLGGWSEVLRQVHEAGGRMMPELWHAGLCPLPHEAVSGEYSPYDPALKQIGPSGYLAPGLQVGLEMSQTEIDAVIDAYARGAEQAKTRGFDGVELLGAHGFLIDQFFWHETNKRRDGYGGSMRNRARFAAEIIAEIRRRTGPDFPIVIRISQWKLVDFVAQVARSAKELEEWLGPLVDAGVDAFDCSQRRYWEPVFEGSPLNLAGWAKTLTGKPSIAVGSVGLEIDLHAIMKNFQASPLAPLNKLFEMMERDEFDMIAVGRGQIADPDWSNKVREQRYSELLPFTLEAFRQNEYIAKYEKKGGNHSTGDAE
ncbi:MAG: NADH:flavin oxidoreductase [Sphingobium sp.]